MKKISYTCDNCGGLVLTEGNGIRTTLFVHKKGYLDVWDDPSEPIGHRFASKVSFDFCHASCLAKFFSTRTPEQLAEWKDVDIHKMLVDELIAAQPTDN